MNIFNKNLDHNNFFNNGKPLLKEQFNRLKAKHTKMLNTYDATVDIIKMPKKSIDYWVSELDKCLYDSMKEVCMATGDVIGILNSDDLYQDDNEINEIMSNFNGDRNLDILFGDIVFVESDKINKVVRNWKIKPYSKYYFENGNVSLTQLYF